GHSLRSAVSDPSPNVADTGSRLARCLGGGGRRFDTDRRLRCAGGHRRFRARASRPRPRARLRRRQLSMSPCAAAIIAGGQATRMQGRNKSLLLVEGERVIDRQLRVLRPLFDEILVVANRSAPYADLGLPVTGDVVPGGYGPLVGILSALEVAHADRVLCVACDMPY